MQTILGAGGTIGIELAKALPSYTKDIRLVSRNPQKVNLSDQLMSADLTIASEINEAVKGSSIVYVTIGFPYSYKFWRAQWPQFISDVVEACAKHDAKLVFFDNVYLYDKDHLNGMTETTTINPPSKKGKVREEVFRIIMNAVDKGRINALIARAADFYGPGIQQVSMLTETVFVPFSQGRKANWMGSVKYRHSYTFTPDAGKATALLGNSPDAYNQVWHLPTAADPFTGKEWIDAIAREMGVEPRYREAGRLIVQMLGIFVPIMREMPEMMYQNDRDYVFSSEKFEKAFDLKPTPYLEGIHTIVEADYRK